MKKPNFFIVGAPKCGTTALSEYLRSHPNIFMSTPKEPHFFAEDMKPYRFCSTLTEYLRLFDDADSHKAIGEASVLYLYSENAIEEIHKFNPSSKIIVMLRSPVEYLPSFHNQLVFNSDEVITEFQESWNLQYSRKEGRNISKRSRIPKLLYYKEVGLLGAQVENLLNIFPENQVHFIFMDDFKNDVKIEYLKVLNFLNIEDDGKNEFPVINKNKVYRSTKINRLKKSKFIKVTRKVLNELGIEKFILFNKLKSLNIVEKKRTPLSPKFRKELIETFITDIELLERLLNKDLTHWKE